MEKIIFEKQKRLGCLNLIVWDFVAVAFVVFVLVIDYPRFHPVFGILIGIVVGAFFILLMKVKYIGTIMQIICSLCWSVALWFVFIGVFGIDGKFGDDRIWEWFFKISLFLFITLVHFVSLRETKEGIAPIMNDVES